MKALVLKYKLELIGAIVGAIGGWMYWRFVGCSSGSCSIMSSPIKITIYWVFMGEIGLIILKNVQLSIFI
ncbi:MAG: hypothetical protein ACK476_15480 [Fluviicola sp.]